MSSSAQWSALRDRLQPRFATLAVDLHGYGRRPMPCAEHFSLADEAALVLSEIDATFGAGARCHLVGHSYGGAVALHLACRHPGRVASITLHEPVAFWLLGPDHPACREVHAVANKVAHWAVADPDRATRAFIDYWNQPGTFDRLREASRSSMAAQIGKVALDFRALFGERLGFEDLHSLSIPACLTAGRQSVFSTRHLVQVLHRGLAGARYVEVAGGHMAPLTHADELNAVVAGFLEHLTSDAEAHGITCAA
jgi:pimeloyl-ACP methyl ester carboxylesterase